MSSEARFGVGLGSQYAQRLKERRPALASIQSRLQRGSAHLDDFETLERESHKLSGSGTTYGFPEITSSAIPLCSKLRAGGYMGAEISALLNILLAAIDKVIAEVSRAEPTAEAASETDWVVDARPAEPPAPAASGYRPAILIADDDPTMRDILVELMLGFALVQCAGTGREVIEAVRTRRFDVILLDLNMPDMDGLQILSRIRSMTEPSHTSIMMITASGDARNVAQLLRAGARDYVVKPFVPYNLLRRVQTLINKRPPVVLVADDDPLIRHILGAKLKQRGVNVIAASNGAEALEKVRHSRPHLIVLDRAMPRMDGLDVLIEIRKDASTRTIPVVILSARRYDNDISEGMRYGADDYIPKPFLPDVVVMRCMSLLPPTTGLAA